MTNPITVSEAVSEALKNNPELRGLVADVAATKGEVVTARTFPNPELTVEPGARQTQAPEGSRSDFHANFALSQLFEFPGKRALKIALAERDLTIRRIALEGFRFQLSTGVVGSTRPQRLRFTGELRWRFYFVICSGKAPRQGMAFLKAKGIRKRIISRRDPTAFHKFASWRNCLGPERTYRWYLIHSLGGRFSLLGHSRSVDAVFENSGCAIYARLTDWSEFAAL